MANIYDGDSPYINGRTGRLLGGDTPELDPAQPGGQQAKAALSRALDLGYGVRPTGERDHHGRELASAAAPGGGPTATQEMVADGLASPMHWPSIETPGEHKYTYAMRGAQALSGTAPSALQQDPRYQQLVAESRSVRLAALQDRIERGAIREAVLTPKGPRDPRETNGIISSSWDRGVDTTQASFYGFANALGELTGVDYLAEMGEEGILRNLGEAALNPARVASYEDIDGYLDAGIYALEAMVEFAPQLVVDAGIALGSGGIGTLSKHALAGIGKQALRNLGGSTALDAARGLGFAGAAKAGAFASMYAQSTGETQMELRGEGVDAPSTALAVGVAKAALDYAPMMGILKGVAGRATGDAVPDSMGALLGGAGVAVAKGAMAEGPTEAAQTLMDEYAKVFHKDGYKVNPTHVIDAALKGAIAGGGMQGGGTLAVDSARMLSKATADNARRDTTPEPLGDVQAQIGALPEGGHRYFSPSNRPEVGAVAEQAAQSGAPLSIKELGNGGVVVARSDEALAAVPDDLDPADDESMKTLLGFEQTKAEAMADPAGVTVLEAEDAQGNVVSSQLVGASRVGELSQVIAAKNPGTTVVQRSVEEAQARRAELVERDRRALEAARTGTPRVVQEPAPAPQAPESPAEREPAKPIDSEALVEEAKRRGIDTSRYIERTPRVDRAAARRVLLRNLDSVLPDTAAKVRDELGNRRIEALSDDEVSSYLDRLEIAERPTEFGGVENEEAFRNDVAATVAHHVEMKFDPKAAEQKGVNLAPLAELLGVSPDALQRSGYAGKDRSANAQTFAFKQGVNRLIREKFGSTEGMIAALRELPAAQLHSLSQQLGLKVRGHKVEPAMDESLAKAALAAEVDARQPTVQKTSWGLGLPGGKEQRESAAPTPAQEKMQEAVNVARQMADLLFEKAEGSDNAITYTDVSGKQRTRSAGPRNAGQIVRRDAGYALNKLDGEARQGAVRMLNKLIGDRFSVERQRFVDAVREAMVASKGRDDRRVAAEHLYDEDGELLETGYVEAEGLTEALEPTEERMLAELMAVPRLRNLSMSDSTIRGVDERSPRKAAELLENATAATRVLTALQILVSPEDIGLGDKARLETAGETHTRRAHSLAAAVRGFLPTGMPVEPFVDLVVARSGLRDAEVASVKEGVTAEEAVRGILERVPPAHTRAMRHYASNVLSRDAHSVAAILEANGLPAGSTQELDPKLVEEYLTGLVQDDPAAALSMLDNALANFTGDRFSGIEIQELAQMYENLGVEQRSAELDPAPDDALARAADVYGEGEGSDAETSTLAQSSEARHGAMVDRDPEEASNAQFSAMLWQARAKTAANGQPTFVNRSASAERTLALKGRNLFEFEFENNGFQLRSAFDLVALAMYAQGGGRAPSNPVEALTNLYLNIDRAMVGDTRGAMFPLRFMPTTALPTDDAVFYVEPTTGKGITIGEAKGIQRQARIKESSASEKVARRDALSQQVGIYGELLADLLGSLQQRQAEIEGLPGRTKALSDEHAAVVEWIDALTNQHYVQRKRSAGVEQAFRAIGKRRFGENLQKQVARLLDLDAVKLTDITAMGVFSKNRKALGDLKKLGAELRELGVDNEYDEFAQAQRHVAREDGLGFDLTGTARAAEQSLRGKEGVMGVPEREDLQEFQPTVPALDHGVNLTPAGYLAEVQQARYESVMARAKLDAKLAAEVEQGRALEAGRKAKQKAKTVEEEARDEVKLARLAAKVRRAQRKGDPKALAVAKPNVAPDDKINPTRTKYKLDDVQRTAYKANPETGEMDFGAQPTSVPQGTLRVPPATPPRGAAPVRMFGRKSVELRAFIGKLQEAGIPLPGLMVGVQPESVDELVAQVGDEAARPAIEKAWAEGGSFYLRVGDQALVVLRPVMDTRAELLTDLAHELGHAVKDQVWMDLNDNHRAELEAAFTRDEGIAPGDDDSLLHEWFANQFAQEVLRRHAGEEHVAKGTVAEAIRDLARTVLSIWEFLSGAVKGIAPEFTRFAESLFAGDYATAEGAPRSRGSQTWTAYHASGAERLQQTHNWLRMGATRAKGFWKNGALPDAGRRMLQMVVSRIRVHSPALAGMLFQQAGTEVGVAGRAWDQRRIALRDRMNGFAEQALAVVKQRHKGKAAQRLAVRNAFIEAMSGSPVSEDAVAVRSLMDQMAQVAADEGLRSVPLEKGFAIAVFDREQVDARRIEFEALLAEKLGEGADVRGIVSRILEGVGVVEGAIAPGMPVGTHASTRAILEAIPYAELNARGWLLQEPEAALFHWVDGVSKRAAWDSVFGEYVENEDHNLLARRLLGRDDPDGSRLTSMGLMDAEGRVFDHNAKYRMLMAEVRDSQGVSAAADLQDLVDGALGRHGQTMPRGVRRIYHGVADWIGLTLLAFSGVASLPELGQPLVRAGGTVNLGNVFRDLPQARKFARDMGIIVGDVSAHMVGEQYQAPLMQKISQQFFKWNGNQLVVNMARTLAVSVGLQYLQSAVELGDHGALRRLNIDAATIEAWVAMGRPTWNPQLPQSEQAVARAVADAVNQFVGEATLRPSRFQATNWGNNPWFKMVWQLKHFLYTYGDTVLGYLWRETHRRWGNRAGVNPAALAVSAAPLLLFGVFVLPLAAGAMEARDWFRRLNGVDTRRESTGSAAGDAAGYLWDVFSRAGGLGPMSVLTGMGMAAEYDRSPLLSLSPMLAKAEYLFDFGDDGELNRAEAADKARSLVPVWSQNKSMFGGLD